MLRTLPQTRTMPLSMRLLAVALFTVLTAVSARISIEIGGPAPFTLQVLVVLLSGLTLGWRDGALSQITYLGLIAAGAPIDARMLGAAAFAGPTAGFLVGFVPGAAVAGLLAERGGTRLVVRWLAGLAGVAVIYLCGAGWFALSTQRTLAEAFSLVVAPFVGLDVVKALIAAGLTEGARALLRR
ncbi:MAG: biotin transporter BioY [Anaerolineae bacterium]|nr:biotin transporter BioY [Anaerolineae bacterium]